MTAEELNNGGLSTSTPSISQAPVSPLSDGLPIHIYKNRSTGNLPAESTKSMEGTRIRFSIDAGNPSEHDPMGRSPVMQEHEHGLGVSGLRRIRQQPQSRPPTLPPSPEASFTSPSRSSSLTLNFPNPRTFTPGGPASPTLNFSEDLTRFPSESLHSFSFAHQSEDVLHNRQNILKRSIDFMRDRLGWAANNPGLVNAQAKVSGDVEIQSMMELLARANVLGPEKDREKGITFHGPLTGPANVEGKNVFEKSFLPRSESPDQLEPSSSSPVEVLEGRNGQSGQTFLPNSKVPSENMRSEHDRLSSLIAGELPTTSKAPASYATRPGMKRTYTDISSLSLQSKLMEALAKPYFPGDWEHEHHLLAPNIIPSLGKAVNGSSYAPSTAHGHANRWAPAAQVIFTTEAKAPWTILAANDLACLVFGVTKAEIRKLGILEVVREDRRDWLEEKLRAPGSEAAIKARQNKSGRSSPYSTTSMPMGGGITAKLLSKPPARSMAGRRAMTDDGSGSSYGNKNNVRGGPNHPSNKSRGVLLCGDIIGIQKRNGATGSASVWVKEKRGGLIWVLEEIVEDIAELTVDGAGKVINATGSTSMIWGHNKAPERVDIRKLIPCLPIIEGRSRQEVDYDKIKELEHFTARHSDGYNIPISIVARPALGELRVSSFPHIAGIMVLSSSNLTITSSNSVFSAALFGLQNPNGLSVNQLLPQFDKILKLMIEEEQIRLVDGMVIPEHSFRRARALLALREGSPDAAAIFLRQTGLVARHRDGADINVDVQLRVVKSECLTSEEPVIIEQNEDETSIEGSMSTPAAEVVYALWITYSRHLHSIVRPGDPVSPLISRPGTPPRQPSPGQSVNIIAPEQIDSEDANDNSKMSLLTQQIQEAASEPISAKPHAQPPIEIKPSPSVQEALPKKKTINDFIILQEMGQGAYGQVKLARYKKTSSKVVLKYVTKKRILVDTWARDRRLGTVPLEIHVLDYVRRDGLKHPNIVEMIDFFEDNLNYYIEMIPHGLPGMDLFDYIEMRSTMQEAECRNIFLQVVAALHHLHTKALVVHRDIKDENIILDGENKVKLIDFGSAAYIKNGPFDVFVGTIDYAAPEVLQGRSYRGKEQDVWALGILLYTLVYKENPFYSVDEILDHELRVPWVMSEGSIDLIRAMLNRDVEKRLTIGQVREHPWCVEEEG